MDRFEELRNFVRVVDAGSITRAADQARVAKSAISRRLAELETRLGVQLINRTTRRMTLTEAGRRFYDDSNRLLGELDHAEAAVAAGEAALSGRIRLAAPTEFGARHLAPAIVAFAARHPAIEFDIDFNDRRIDIVEEGFDLALRIARLSDSRLVARRLTTVTAVVAASPAYWQRHKRPQRPQDLRHHRGLHYSNQSSTTWRYQAPGGASGSVRVPSTLQANSGAFLLAAALDGLGIIRLPRFVCYEALRAGGLQAVFADYQWSATSAAYAVYPRTRNLPGRIRAFIDFLTAQWGEVPYWEDC